MFSDVNFLYLAHGSLHELYKAPHLWSISPTFILFDLFLKRQICYWMSPLSVASPRLLAHCGIDMWNEAFKETGKKIHYGMGISYLSKICCGHCLWNKGKTALEGSAASLVLYLLTFSRVKMHVHLVFYLVWVLFSILRKAVMLIAHCMTESQKYPK